MQVEPLWQHRPGRPVAGNGWEWDLDGTPPPDSRLAAVRGIVVLAGATGGDAAALAANTTAALAAVRLRDAGVAGPVLLLSSAAVYGRATGPLTEDMVPTPANSYGASKATMEAAVAGRAGVTCLRLANVAGADALFGAMSAGPVTLDRFADGTAPRRSYIGPLTLARVLLALIAANDLPPVLNVASPGPLSMDLVLEAAGARWTWTPAPATALPCVALDTARLARIIELPPADAAVLVAEARAAGWSAAS